METKTGILFDIYHIEETVYLWIRDEKGDMICCQDRYYPEIYIHGSDDNVRKIVGRLEELKAVAEPPQWVLKKHFYSDTELKVLKVKIKKPSVLRRISKKLYMFYGIMDIYHSDLDLLSHYMQARQLYPLAEVKFTHENRFIKEIQCIYDIDNTEYEIPDLKIITMKLSGSHRLPAGERNRLCFEIRDRKYSIWHNDPVRFLSKVNAVMELEDPDVILSSFGDQTILPFLFRLSNELKIPLNFDRDRSMKTVRRILTEGTSYTTYGQWIFKAPSYPLFGRWHIDSANSFVYKETELQGIIELARISRMPVQKLARSSTGTALTNIETFAAIDAGYLVPWQKSSLEQPKTAYQLLRIDKGGLVFQPYIKETQVYENVAQLDFSQMYPSLMVNHNLSPETVNCVCCRENRTGDRVPGTHYYVCKRRKGVVAIALEKVLKRRKHYKQRMKETEGQGRELYSARQNSLKWMLVTSFGYLGYRNAKFGKLESHESVTAWGRESLLTAKHIAEEKGYLMLHGITDCIFIQKPDRSKFMKEELQALCREVTEAVNVELAIEGIYSWLVFPSSKQDSELPVTNRYFGRFEDGTMKIRGLYVRRKDIPFWIRSVQSRLLDIMQEAGSLKELKAKQGRVGELYESVIQELHFGKIPWQELAVRKTVSKHLDEYEVENGTSLSMQELKDIGSEIQPGEKIQFVVKNQKSKIKSERYSSFEKLQSEGKEFIDFDFKYYEKLVYEAFEEAWQYFAPKEYFASLKEKQNFLSF